MKRFSYRLMLSTALTLAACTVDPDDNDVESDSGAGDRTSDVGDPDAVTTDSSDSAEDTSCTEEPPACDGIESHCAGPTLAVTYPDDIPLSPDCTCDYAAVAQYVECGDLEACEDGECVDPCADVEDPTCPLEICIDATTQGIYSADGTCDPVAGDCAYEGTAAERVCESGVCEDGVCRVACSDNICATDETCSEELSCLPIDCVNDDDCTETSVRMTCIELTCQFP
jgi:hypothetical protein